jgi:hypothetical protein
VATIPITHGKAPPALRKKADGTFERTEPYGETVVGLQLDTDYLLARLEGAPFDPNRFKIRTLADALKPQPPLEWRVEGLIAEGSFTIMPGAPGSGKTYLASDLCLCHAAGVPWLGRQTIKGPTLIVDEESGERRLSARLAAVARARGISEDAELSFTCLQGFNLRESLGAFVLTDVIKNLGAKLVLIDTLVSIMPGGNENAVEDMQPILMRLRRIAEETKAAIVVIHHTNKNGDYRGSTSILGAVDTMMQVERRSGLSAVVDVKSIKTRDTAPFQFAAAMRFEGEPYQIPDRVFITEAETGTDDRPKEWNSGERYVLSYLSKHGRADVKTICDNADSCAPRTARNAIYSLVDAREIVRVDGGRPGEPATYALRSQAEKGEEVPF